MADLEHIRQSLDLQKLTFIAHSLGGIFAVLYSSTYTEYIEKIVVLDSTFAFNREPCEVFWLIIWVYL